MENLILKKWMMTLLIVMCLSGGIFAQAVRLKGYVKDKVTEKPLPGVTILVKGTFIGTVTNEDGEFVILAPRDSIVVFSFVGYVTLEVPVNNWYSNIFMEEGMAVKRSLFSGNKIILKREFLCILREERDVI